MSLFGADAFHCKPDLLKKPKYLEPRNTPTTRKGGNDTDQSLNG